MRKKRELQRIIQRKLVNLNNNKFLLYLISISPIILLGYTQIIFAQESGEPFGIITYLSENPTSSFIIGTVLTAIVTFLVRGSLNMKKQLDTIDIVAKAEIEARIQTEKRYDELCKKIDKVGEELNKKIDKYDNDTNHRIDSLATEQSAIRKEFNQTIINYLFGEKNKGHKED